MRHISHRRRVPMTSVFERALLVVTSLSESPLLVVTSARLGQEPVFPGMAVPNFFWGFVSEHISNNYDRPDTIKSSHRRRSCARRGAPLEPPLNDP